MNLAVPMIVAWLVSATPRSCDAEDADDDYSDNYFEYSNVTNCTNDYCIPDEDYIELMVQHIFPKFSYWVLIAMHSIVFVVGLIGNALVCMAVYRNHSMRNVTNYFIVNLAVADLLVLLICLPPSVLWDVTETWFLGLKLCKAVPYLQFRANSLRSGVPDTCFRGKLERCLVRKLPLFAVEKSRLSPFGNRFLYDLLVPNQIILNFRLSHCGTA
ncbi:Orexin receptor type 2 [Temnothorax longispinosus]|uniref:Orexin receptor type 2 n=1 Tax=Temnothorax longispinosus TaxID=300112 RepID=A0A4S2KDC1_9HYME|nr:Orexin receptor type 2 [Temnothorax longispinosus]